MIIRTRRSAIFEALKIDIPPLLFDLMEMKPIINFADNPYETKKSEGDDKDFEYMEKW